MRGATFAVGDVSPIHSSRGRPTCCIRLPPVMSNVCNHSRPMEASVVSSISEFRKWRPDNKRYWLDGKTDRSVMVAVAQPQGQSRFRRELMQAYGERCAISDRDLGDALEAADTVPCSGPDTNYVRTGLLLRSDLHTLFKRGLIGICPDKWRGEGEGKRPLQPVPFLVRGAIPAT